MKAIEKLRGLKSSRKGVGLLAIWVSAIAAMFSLYFIYRIVTPIIGELDYHAFMILTDPNFAVSESWLTLYEQIDSVMQNAFAVLIYACFVSVVLFVIVQSARRRTDQYEREDF